MADFRAAIGYGAMGIGGKLNSASKTVKCTSADSR